MSVKKLKDELVKLITDTDDEELLHLLKEDVAYYQTSGSTDITDNLSAKQIRELEKLAEEPDEKDVITLDQFKEATQKWRTK